MSRRICPGCRSRDEVHTFDPMVCSLVGAFNTPIEVIPEVVSERARTLGKMFASFRFAVGDSERSVKGSTGLTVDQVKLLEEGRIEERFIERHFKMYVDSIMGTNKVDPQRVMQAFSDYHIDFASRVVRTMAVPGMRVMVDEFSREMETRLVKNAHKGCSWREDDVGSLLRRLRQEFGELEEAIYLGKGNVVHEAADVANFAMMIADLNKNWSENDDRVPDGLPGIRDQDSVCEKYLPGNPRGECCGDGHYLCLECEEYKVLKDDG
jgi:hypothetical protein